MQTRLTKKTTAKIIALAVAAPFLILLFSFTTTKSESKKLIKENYTGKQIFSAIYLHDKTLSAELNTYKKIRHEFSVSVKQENAYTEILNEIEKESPLFFEEFKKNITSGNHIAIKAQIKEGQTKLLRITSKFSANNTNIKDDETAPYGNPYVFIPPIVVVEWAISPVLPVAIVLPLGPPSLPLSNNEASTLGKLKNDNLFCELLVDELVAKFK